jgi:hypothetical protein
VINFDKPIEVKVVASFELDRIHPLKKFGLFVLVLAIRFKR